MFYSLVAVLVLASLVFTACGESKSFEAGGLSIVVGENGEFIQGETGTWEVAGKYKIEITGVYYDDTGASVEPILDENGNVDIEPEGYFAVVYNITNLGYELTDKDMEKGGVDMSSMYTTFRINDGKEKYARPYPYEADDYKYSYKDIKLDYIIPAVPKGETEEFYNEFVTNKEIDLDNDVLVFTTFFNDGENTYDGVFEMKFSSLSKFLED